MKEKVQDNWLENLYAYTRQMASEMGLDLWDIRLSVYDIILEARLSEVTQSVYFYADDRFRENFITEIKLHKYDWFLAGKWGLFILDTKDEEDISFSESTFPDSRIFDCHEASQMQAFYKGRMWFSINNCNVLNGVPTDQFRIDHSSDSKRMCGIDPLIEMDQRIVLQGTKNNVFRLNLPVGVDLSGSRRRLRLRLRGLLLKDAKLCYEKG